MFWVISYKLNFTDESDTDKALSYFLCELSLNKLEVFSENLKGLLIVSIIKVICDVFFL